MKRCVISGEGGFKFRVSTPGIDVDAAGPNDFVFHESYLFTQPYAFKWAACPFAGNTSINEVDQTVNVPIPNVTADPLVVVYPVSESSLNVFPLPVSEGSGSDTSGYTRESWSIYVKSVSATNISIRFYKPRLGLRSPRGCYLILMKRPT